MNFVRHSRRPGIPGKVLSWPRRRFAVALVAVGLVPADTAGSLASAADSADITSSIVVPSPGQTDVLPAVNRPFRPGESLKFSVQWGPIHAGTAYLQVPLLGEWDGHPSYTLLARAESNAFVSRFYKVRNRIESVWDRDGRFSHRYAEDRHEGHWVTQDSVVFDQERGEARYNDGRTFPVPPRVQDALSAFYYTRFLALPIGGSVLFDYHASHKSQPLEVKVLGRERIETPAGKFNCVVIEPILHAGGVFKHNGRLVIWLTDDDRRMPVLMRSKVAIGSVSVVLQEAKVGA